MKALAVVLAVLLVLAHPAAAAAIVGPELAVCCAVGRLFWRAARPRLYPHWRTA